MQLPIALLSRLKQLIPALLSFVCPLLALAQNPDHQNQTTDGIVSPPYGPPMSKTLPHEKIGEGKYRLRGKLMDDGGGQLHFLGFILANKSLNEIAAGLDPNELLPMTEWETDESVPLGRIGVDGIPLDGKLNFYTDVDLEPGKRYHYWSVVVNASGVSSDSPKKLTLPSSATHWWSQATLLDGGWRSYPWFGDFLPDPSGWIYHARLGWAYAHPDGHDGLWLWIEGEGWLWTRQGVFPYLWRHHSKSWALLVRSANAKPIFYEWWAKDSNTLLTVELNQAAFPATVTKFGFNAEWTQSNAADRRAIDEAGEAGAPMVAGLMEIDYLKDDWTFLKGSTLNSPLFYKSGDQVLTQSDPDLDKLRERVVSHGMINLLQLAGTPTKDGVFRLDTSLEDSVTFKDDFKGKHGNWYPLPVVGEETDALGLAYASLTRSIRAATPGLPTWWAFWQEPDHTIGKNLDKDESKRRYLDFFGKMADAIKAGNQDSVIIGIQQNSSTGLNGANGPIDGADYLHFTENVLLPFEESERNSRKIPYDYVSIQNYKAHRTLEIVKNARIAYRDPRFGSMPILINECDFRKMPGWVEKSFAERYDEPAGLIQFMEILRVMLEQPDIAYTLLMRNLFSYTVEEEGDRFTTGYHALNWLNGLPAHRRPANLSGPGSEDLRAVAAADSNRARVIVWNTASEPRKLDVDLKNISPVLDGRNLYVHKIDGGQPQARMEMVTTSPLTTFANLEVPGRGIVMLKVGDPIPAIGLRQARYARHYSWVPRTGTEEPPAGEGHYQVREASLVASTADETGIGLAGVVLSDLPTDLSYLLEAKLTTSGLPASSEDGVLGLRLDYLDRNRSLSTEYFLANDHYGSQRLEDVSFWVSSPDNPLEKRVHLSDGLSLPLPIGALAPGDWATADDGRRRILVTLLLRGIGPATVSARLSD